MGKSAPTPDYSAVAAAQRANNRIQKQSNQILQSQVQTGKDQLVWSQQVQQQNQPLVAEATQQQIAAQKQAMDQAKVEATYAAENQKFAEENQAYAKGQQGFTQQQEDLYSTSYAPLIAKYAGDVQQYASPNNIATIAGGARGSTAAAIDAQQQAARTNLESYGVDPTATRYASLDRGVSAMRGAAIASAGTTAIQQTRLAGLGLEGDASKMGLSIPGIVSGLQNSGSGMAGATAGLSGASSGAAGVGVGGLNAANSGGSAAVGGLNSTFGTAGGVNQGTTAFTNAGIGAGNMGVNSINALGNAVNGFNAAQAQNYATSMTGAAGLGSALGGVFGALMPTNGIMGFAEGGPTGGMQTPGGAVPMHASPSRGQNSDDVPAQLTAGEFVMPKDVVEWKGQEYFVKQIDAARKGAVEMSQRNDIGGQSARAQPQAPTFTSRPQIAQGNGAVPMNRAA